MPTIPIAPCPFCGNPKAVISRLWSGLYVTRIKRDPKTRRKKEYKDRGTFLGWKLGCPQCYAYIERNYDGSRAMAKCRLDAIWAWNCRRGDQTEATAGVPLPCPLCGTEELQFRFVDVEVSGCREPVKAQSLWCTNEDCGLLKVGIRPNFDPYDPGYARTEIVSAWNERRSTDEWTAPYEAALLRHYELQRAEAVRQWKEREREDRADRAEMRRLHMLFKANGKKAATTLKNLTATVNGATVWMGIDISCHLEDAAPDDPPYEIRIVEEPLLPEGSADAPAPQCEHGKIGTAPSAGTR
jgi:hypothetical protein